MVPANQQLFKLLTNLTPQTGVIKIDGENFNDLKPVSTEGWDYFQNPDDQHSPTVQREVGGVSRRSWMTTTRLRQALAALKRVGLDDKNS